MEDGILTGKARGFAISAHDSIGQVRKYTGEPYWRHPEAVVTMVSEITHDDVTLAAAWLHDTVEDTPVTIDEIASVFGYKVAQLVSELTDVSKPEDGKRKVRKEIDRQHTAKASPEAKTIKLADLIDNTKSIVERDPSFAKVYLKEKALLLEVLKEGNQVLYDRATKLLKLYSQENA